MTIYDSFGRRNVALSHKCRILTASHGLFAIVYTVSFIKMDENNTFQWNINQDNLTGDFWRNPFVVDGCRFSLNALHQSYGNAYGAHSTIDVLKFSLYRISKICLPFSYTFSIFDHEGQDFITTKGKILRNETEWLIMVLDYDNLYKNYKIHRHSLTVRFTRNREQDAQEIQCVSEEKSSNVVDSTTNTNPLVTKDSSTSTDEEDTTLLETLSNDFSTFYENKSGTDCVLRVSDSQFHVHRAVLSARSSVFSAMFHHDTAENRSGEVNIPDVKATAIDDILFYVYSGKIRGLTADSATSMYTVADKYDLLELRTKCLEFLKRELTMDNFCEAALLAHTHAEMELEQQVVWFIEEKLDDVLESNVWQQFLKDRTLIASKLLTSALLSSKKKFRDIISK